MNVSKHFVADKVKALCVVRELQNDLDVLPLVATGGWDNEINHVSLHLPVRTTRPEWKLCKEFERGEDVTRPCELNKLAEAEHDGDVNALQFVATRSENLLVSASSTGSVFAYRVSSSAEDDAAMTDVKSNKPLASFVIPQWENVFTGTAATCLEVSENRSSLVSASADGALAWLKLDDVATVEKIENKGVSKLPINAVKFLGRDSVVASVGSSPGSQLRIWDTLSSNQFPITTSGDSSRTILTTLETHPTRPELLITGSDEGCVSFWDRRKINAPFRTDIYHRQAVRVLKLHSSSQSLYSAGDDAVIYHWNLNSSRESCKIIECEASNKSSSTQKSNSFAFSAAPEYGNDFERLGGVQVQQLDFGSQIWNALAIHEESDTLVAGSDAQSVVIVQQVSKWKQ